jgi:hypothetical protein
MLRRASLLIAAVFFLATTDLRAGSDLYRIELGTKDVVWSQDRPQERGGLLLFHGYPGGALMSVKRSEVSGIVKSEFKPEASKALRPGTAVELGPTGEGGGRASPQKAGGGQAGAGSVAPNPAFPRWVGSIRAYPPASAVVVAPGAPPMMPPYRGDVPRAPQPRPPQ